MKKILEQRYPVCHGCVKNETWNRIIAFSEKTDPQAFPNLIELRAGEIGAPDYLADLARLEHALYSLNPGDLPVPGEFSNIIVNPTLQILELQWTGLPALIRADGHGEKVDPEPGAEMAAIWLEPGSETPRVETLADEQLLAIKIVLEQLNADDVARSGGLPVGVVDAAIGRAAAKGLLVRPKSRIRRTSEMFSLGGMPDKFLEAQVFTLQWHVTQACDLHCKHCYDRSTRAPLDLEQGIRILDDLRSFCQSRHVRGQVSFSGGNPLLYPHLKELYGAAAERGLMTAILGNAASREQVEELAAIQVPVFYQVSLEGLQEHNDRIRGQGYYRRVMEFLEVLRDLKIYSIVMLTLTAENMDQVLPLAERLRGRADLFSFNRLSSVGEGADLRLPERKDFEKFLKAYLDAARTHPILSLKDNLFNAVKYGKGDPLFGGCTGYGCGAAFNFISLLPDGEVHACRKFPSAVGNLFEQPLAEIYENAAARAYRSGPAACRECSIRAVCGGCLAVIQSHGLDVNSDRDPCCFLY